KLKQEVFEKLETEETRRRKNTSKSSQRKEDLSNSRVFGLLKETLISSDNMSEFEVFQENLAERLEALTPQKEKNNKKPKKGYDNTLEENTKSMRTDLEMQMYSMTSSEQLNKTNESHDVVIILSEPNTNKEDGQVSQINSKTDQSEQQMEIDVEPEVTGDKHKNKTKKMSYSAVVTETKSEAKIKFESERKNKIKRCFSNYGKQKVRTTGEP
ncbi:2228_t:CDS:2, partial [Gigaspora rosea]